jgi:hypothetical protein
VTGNVGTLRAMAPSDSRGNGQCLAEPVALRSGNIAASERGSMSIAKRFLARLSCPALAAAVCVSVAAQAPTRPKRTDAGGDPPKVILWVGHSFFYYNNSLHNHVLGLVRAADPKSPSRARFSS